MPQLTHEIDQTIIDALKELGFFLIEKLILWSKLKTSDKEHLRSKNEFSTDDDESREVTLPQPSPKVQKVKRGHYELIMFD